MKQIIEANDSMIIESFLGKYVTIFCMRYIYTGKVLKIDAKHLVLGECKIVYETGGFETNTWKDAQSLGVNEWVVALDAIEGFGVLNKS
jgi:hypothetical protein